MKRIRNYVIVVCAAALSVPSATAVEILSASELASHCRYFHSEPTGVDGEYCVRYIQGFIDGAVATDVRVMLNAEDDIRKEETFAERAIRTRLPSLDDRRRAARFAEFCLGDELPLRNVVEDVVSRLGEMSEVEFGDVSARDVVYETLRNQYPCRD